MNEPAPVGSREYWRDPASYPEDWSSRSAQAARFIPAGLRVLDIGCGATMSLSRYLAEGCVYLPADLVAWTPVVRLVDIDADIFPADSFDAVTILGVIEYLEAPEKVFRHLKGRAQLAVLSYCLPNNDDTAFRRSVGWVNEFTEPALTSLFELAGARGVRSEVFRTSPMVTQVLYVLSLG